jgi:hypothetical protein
MSDDIYSPLKILISTLNKSPVISIEKIGQSGNSKVCRVTCEDGSIYASKFYFQSTINGLSRMEIEFSALEFMWENGIRVIPKPIASDLKNQIAVYEFIEASEILPEDVLEEDIDKAAEFLYDLKKLSALNESKRFYPASEACFSVKALIENIQSRLNRLKSLNYEGSMYKTMQHFLAEEFVPALDTMIKNSKDKIDKAAFSFELPYNLRTLSPSDYGFHNALRRGNGEMVFFDFEYFGWDDPAKMISDFLLHPAMALSDSLKHRFIEKNLVFWGMDVNLKQRLEIVYPLFGMKWCIILLNEFIPDNLQRRLFASELHDDVNDILMKQLKKAEKMLQKILTENKIFSYKI